MQPTTPQNHQPDVDWSLVWMFVTMTVAIVFLLTQLV